MGHATREYMEIEKRLIDLRKWLKAAKDLPDDSKKLCMTLGDSMRLRDREVWARQESVDHAEGELEAIRNCENRKT